MKKPSSPPCASSRPGRMRTQPSGDGVTKSGSSPGFGGSIAKSGWPRGRRRRPARLPAARASRPNRPALPPGFSHCAARSSSLRLELGALGDDRRPGAVQHFGMAAEGAGRRAGRVEQDRVERPLRLPCRARRPRPARPADASGRDSRAVVRAAFRRVDRVTRWPAAASCMVLPPGAAHRSSTSVASGGISRAGSEAARSCTHQRPSPKPASSATDELSSAHVARRERHAAVRGRIGLRLGIVGEAQVERRALGDLAARGFDDLLAPGRAPSAARPLRAGAAPRCGGRPRAEQRAEHAVDQPARAAVDQRQSGRDQRMVGRAEADLLREREAQHHPRLAIVGQALAGRAVDQRVEVGQAAQRLAGDGDAPSAAVRPAGERCATAARRAESSVWPRRASTRIEHLQAPAPAARAERPRPWRTARSAATAIGRTASRRLRRPRRAMRSSTSSTLAPAGEQRVDRVDDRHVDALARARAGRAPAR